MQSVTYNQHTTEAEPWEYTDSDGMKSKKVQSEL